VQVGACDVKDRYMIGVAYQPSLLFVPVSSCAREPIRFNHFDLTVSIQALRFNRFGLTVLVQLL